MALSAGIVGLPNVGKSTLFNTITNSSVEAANYPFATIEPNVGIVEVNDKRLNQLANLIQPEKLTKAFCQFVDIAGLVKGASNGEGLGNKFLANIREVDAIVHVVRCFEDKNIIHAYESVDPIRDADIINLELIIADLESIDKRIAKLIPKTKAGDKLAILELSICQKIKMTLQANKLAKSTVLNNDETTIAKQLNLLTFKPMLYVANISEEDIALPENNHHYLRLKEYVKNSQNKIVPLAISLEYEISSLDKKDQEAFMKDLGIKTTGLDNLIQATYQLLDLQTFFTFGKKETKAWTFTKGMLAPQCAGIIHSDFERGFIRVEVMNWSDLVELKSEVKVKENGKLRIEGKSYIMQDGDVCHFKFNV